MASITFTPDVGYGADTMPKSAEVRVRRLNAETGEDGFLVLPEWETKQIIAGGEYVPMELEQGKAYLFDIRRLGNTAVTKGAVLKTMPNTATALWSTVPDEIPVYPTAGILGDSLVTGLLSDEDSEFHAALQELFALSEGGQVADGAMALLVADDDTETGGAVAAKIATGVNEELSENPTLVAAAASALGGVMGNLPTQVRTNRVKNPGPNVDPIATDWTITPVNGTASASYATVGSEHAALLTWSAGVATKGGSQVGPGTSTNALIPVTPGEVLTGSLLALASKQQRVRADWRFYNASNTQVGSDVFGSSRLLAAASEEAFTVTGTVPALATHARLFIEVISGHADSTAWVNGDTLRVRRSIAEVGTSVGSYFDGAVGGGTWGGSVGASTSTLALLNFDQANADLINVDTTATGRKVRQVSPTRGEVAGGLRTNLYTNPIADVSTGWGFLTGTGGAVSAAQTSRTYAKDGGVRKGWLATWTTATSAVGGGITVGRTTAVDVPVVASARQRFSVEVIPSKAQRLTLIASIRKADNSFTASAQGTSRIIAAGEENDNTLGVVMDIPADGSHVQLQVVAAGADGSTWAVNDTLFVTNATVETVSAGTTAIRPAFSGQSLGAAWSGTVGASSSTTRDRGVATAHDTLLTGAPKLNGNPLVTTNDLTPDNVRAATTLAASLIASSSRRSPWPIGLAVGADVVDLATLLGAGFTEYAYNDTTHMQWLGLLNSTVTVNSITYRSNAAGGAGGKRTEFGFESYVDSATGTDLVVRFVGNNDDPTQKPSLGIYIDGELVKGTFVRDTSADFTNRRTYSITGIPAGRHVIEVWTKKSDIYSISVSAGATLTATPARTLVGVFSGDSWPSHNDLWGGHIGNGLILLTARALRMNPFFCSEGGSGWTTGTRQFGNAARLDAIEAINTAYTVNFIGIIGSINERNGTPTNVQANATAGLASLATRCPSAKVVLIGPQALGSGANPADLIASTGLAAAAAASPNVIGIALPAVEGWLTDAMVAANIYAVDGIHPTIEGAFYYAVRILAVIIRSYRAAGIDLPGVSAFA